MSLINKKGAPPASQAPQKKSSDEPHTDVPVKYETLDSKNDGVDEKRSEPAQMPAAHVQSKDANPLANHPKFAKLKNSAAK